MHFPLVSSQTVPKGQTVDAHTSAVIRNETRSQMPVLLSQMWPSGQAMFSHRFSSAEGMTAEACGWSVASSTASSSSTGFRNSLHSPVLKSHLKPWEIFHFDQKILNSVLFISHYSAALYPFRLSQLHSPVLEKRWLCLTPPGGPAFFRAVVQSIVLSNRHHCLRIV